MLSDGQVDETKKARLFLAELGDVNQKSWLEFGDKFPPNVFFSGNSLCQAKKTRHVRVKNLIYLYPCWYERGIVRFGI